MKILVTGASGFIGAALCHYLTAKGHEVVPVVRRPTSIRNAQVVTSDEEWDRALRSCDSVIHLAGRAHVMREQEGDPLVAFRVSNVDLTLALARKAVANGVKRFVFSSSIKVNGENTVPGQCFRADDEPDPQDAYANSKWEAEEGLRRIAKETGLEIVTVRPPLVYGPGVKGNFATLIRWVEQGVRLPLGAVNNQRSMIALENLVTFFALCADHKAFPQAQGQVFLVSDGKPVSTTDLLRKIAFAYGHTPSLLPVPVWLMRFGASLVSKTSVADRLFGSLIVDDSKARLMLGWEPSVSMEAQLRKMADAASH